MRIAGIIDESVVDGQGLRAVVFVQGCPHKCEGCHNKTAWNFDGGRDMTAQQVFDSICDNPLLDGITLSGGEPFCQASELSELIKLTRNKGLNTWCYTGYEWHELIELGKTQKDIFLLLSMIDVLVDGKFILSQVQQLLPFKGSSNQRIINVQASLKLNKVVEYSL